MADRRFNVALAGYGYAGRTFHAPLIEAEAGLRLHTVATRRPEAVLAERPWIRATDFDTALADPEIDLVVLATPNDLHAPQARAAILAGKAVVIDKPFALTLAEAQDLAALAAREGRLLSVFHNRRWDSDFLTLRRLIAEDRLGPVVTLESRFDRHRPEVRDRWRERPGPGAGVWHDLGPHLIDQAIQLFGMPRAIQADIAARRSADTAPDYAHAVLFWDEMRAILHMDMLSPAHALRYRVQGRRAGFVKHGLDSQEASLKAGVAPGGPAWGADPLPGALVDAAGRETAVQATAGDYRAYYAAIARALAGRGPNPVTPDQAVQVMAVIEAGLASSDQGRRIVLQ